MLQPHTSPLPLLFIEPDQLHDGRPGLTGRHCRVVTPMRSIFLSLPRAVLADLLRIPARTAAIESPGNSRQADASACVVACASTHTTFPPRPKARLGQVDDVPSAFAAQHINEHVRCATHQRASSSNTSLKSEMLHPSGANTVTNDAALTVAPLPLSSRRDVPAKAATVRSWHSTATRTAATRHLEWSRNRTSLIQLVPLFGDCR
jgi:hypothetical protein